MDIARNQVLERLMGEVVSLLQQKIQSSAVNQSANHGASSMSGGVPGERSLDERINDLVKEVLVKHIDTPGLVIFYAPDASLNKMDWEHRSVMVHLSYLDNEVTIPLFVIKLKLDLDNTVLKKVKTMLDNSQLINKAKKSAQKWLEEQKHSLNDWKFIGGAYVESEHHPYKTPGPRVIVVFSARSGRDLDLANQIWLEYSEEEEESFRIYRTLTTAKPDRRNLIYGSSKKQAITALASLWLKATGNDQFGREAEDIPSDEHSGLIHFKENALRKPFLMPYKVIQIPGSQLYYAWADKPRGPVDNDPLLPAPNVSMKGFDDQLRVDPVMKQIMIELSLDPQATEREELVEGLSNSMLPLFCGYYSLSPDDLMELEFLKPFLEYSKKVFPQVNVLLRMQYENGLLFEHSPYALIPKSIFIGLPNPDYSEGGDKFGKSYWIPSGWTLKRGTAAFYDLLELISKLKVPRYTIHTRPSVDDGAILSDEYKFVTENRCQFVTYSGDMRTRFSQFTHIQSWEVPKYEVEQYTKLLGISVLINGHLLDRKSVKLGYYLGKSLAEDAYLTLIAAGYTHIVVINSALAEHGFEKVMLASDLDSQKKSESLLSWILDRVGRAKYNLVRTSVVLNHDLQEEADLDSLVKVSNMYKDLDRLYLLDAQNRLSRAISD